MKEGTGHSVEKREKGMEEEGVEWDFAMEGDTDSLFVTSEGVLEAGSGSNRKTYEEGLSIMGRPALGCAILRGFDFTTLGI